MPQVINSPAKPSLSFCNQDLRVSMRIKKDQTNIKDRILVSDPSLAI